jgi:hypothetical protein
MVILLISLIIIYVRLKIGRSSGAVKYMVHLPMSVYFGKITIAAIANATALLVAYEWNRFGISEKAWAVVMIIVGIAIGLLVLFSRRDIFYALVVDWAMIGILIKRTADSSTSVKGVIITSIAGIVLLTAGVIVQIARRKVYR